MQSKIATIARIQGLCRRKIPRVSLENGISKKRKRDRTCRKCMEYVKYLKQLQDKGYTLLNYYVKIKNSCHTFQKKQNSI